MVMLWEICKDCGYLGNSHYHETHRRIYVGELASAMRVSASRLMQFQAEMVLREIHSDQRS